MLSLFARVISLSGGNDITFQGGVIAGEKISKFFWRGIYIHAPPFLARGPTFGEGCGIGCGPPETKKPPLMGRSPPRKAPAAGAAVPDE